MDNLLNSSVKIKGNKEEEKAGDGGDAIAQLVDCWIHNSKVMGSLPTQPRSGRLSQRKGAWCQFFIFDSKHETKH